jgi:hypothetical protein
MTRFLGFQTSISNCTFYHQSRVHCYVTGTTRRHSSHEPATGNEGARFPSHLHLALCIARYSRTTLVLWNSQGFPNYAQGPSTSMFAIIIFASMCARDLSRYSLSTQKTRLLTYLPSLWHKMTFNVIVAPCAASNLSQATKVREFYKFGYFGTYLWYLPVVSANDGRTSKTVWQVFGESNWREGSVTKLGYFGTYLRYLPVVSANDSIVTTFQLIPVGSMTSHFNPTVPFRHSTSSSIVELVSFC